MSVHVGSVIPLDGVVVSGEAMVNQASMTGESAPVRKETDMYVYAGTAVEEGAITLCVKKAAGSTRFERIVKMIEESEKLKSSVEGKAATLADALEPGRANYDSLPPQYSHLYLAIDGRLAAVICIEDPLREEAAEVIESLRKLGVKKIVMMTGDSERTAKAIAKAVGVDDYDSEVLPEDKAEFVESEKMAGRKVIMIGDGINDSPALSAADVGIAISEGAEIAREIADITISEDALFQLVTLKAISNALMLRVHRNYRFVIGFNLGLILLGVNGVIAPAMSALLHNTSTLYISLRSMTNLSEK